MPLSEEDKIYNEQIDLIDSAKRELTNFSKEPQQRKNVHVYKRHIGNLDEYRECFLQNHRKLVRQGLDDKDDYIVKKVPEAFEEAYITAYSAIQTAIDALPAPQVRQETSTTLERLLERTLERSLGRQGGESTNPPPLECNLPKLTIPHFTGDQSLWPAFHDSFLSSIHNNNRLSHSKKFQYLKGVLSGEPELIIRHIVISDATYEEAWQLLLTTTSEKCSNIK